MAGIDDVKESLQPRLDELARKHNVVGATVAVQQGNAVVAAATGLTNARTRVPTTTDTLFQIGSISKVYTATLVMQLVDEGLVDLDEPVRRYLPDFAVADREATANVTIRQLLTHTSGIDGDVFDDFGRGDDCVEKYVDAMSGTVQINPPGAFFSYCNSGFVALGRLVEHMRGLGWDAALREHLLEPLGAPDSVTLPEEAILRRAAVGHLPTGPDGALQVAPLWFMARAVGPAGIISAPACDVLAFARLHLDGGRAADGTQLLSSSSVKLMQELQVELPDRHTLGDAWGLGWILYKKTTPKIIGHDGGTIGQGAFLRIVPDSDLVVVLLTNGGGVGALYGDLVRSLLRELADTELNPNAVPSETPVDVAVEPFVGTFERSGVRMEITRDEDAKIWLKQVGTGPLASALPDEPPTELVVLDDVTLITATADPRLGRHLPLKFLDRVDSGFRYVHFGGRATPRAGA